MELTGKAKTDFDLFIKNELYYLGKEHLADNFMNTLYVEFFDSKEIFIHVKRNCTGIKFNHWYCIITDVKGVHLNNFLKDESKEDDRNLILNCAIKKANEIYNLNYGRK